MTQNTAMMHAATGTRRGLRAVPFWVFSTLWTGVRPSPPTRRSLRKD